MRGHGSLMQAIRILREARRAGTLSGQEEAELTAMTAKDSELAAMIVNESELVAMSGNESLMDAIRSFGRLP